MLFLTFHIPQSNQIHSQHRHKSGPDKNNDRTGDLGMMGVLIHVIGDATNNLGVTIASSIIWKAEYQGKYYADPAISMGISIMISLSSIPLGKYS